MGYVDLPLVKQGIQGSKTLSGSGDVVSHALPTESSDSLCLSITIHVRKREDVQLPSDSLLAGNDIYELLTAEELPDFAQQLEQELHLQRSPSDVSLAA
jgi:hypothetical protein